MRTCRFMLFAISLAITVIACRAIKCYDCRSENGQCKNGECKINGGVCAKREKNFGNGTWIVIKGCRGAPIRNRECEYDQSLAPGGQICFCDKADFCNTAYSTILNSSRSFYLISISILVLSLYYHVKLCM